MVFVINSQKVVTRLLMMMQLGSKTTTKEKASVEMRWRRSDMVHAEDDERRGRSEHGAFQLMRDTSFRCMIVGDVRTKHLTTVMRWKRRSWRDN